MSQVTSTDLYEVTMALSYLREDMRAPATFSLFVRDLPPGRGTSRPSLPRRRRSGLSPAPTPGRSPSWSTRTTPTAGSRRVARARRGLRRDLHRTVSARPVLPDRRPEPLGPARRPTRLPARTPDEGQRLDGGSGPLRGGAPSAAAVIRRRSPHRFPDGVGRTIRVPPAPTRVPRPRAGDLRSAVGRGGPHRRRRPR
ncbi:hypothetical protein EF909_13145 [Streptomyces sp. WAC01280]|nr:hypothetical protein EF909_13145 [Streptomyces sp. WAC01280]